MKRGLLLLLVPLVATTFVVTDFGIGAIGSSVAVAEKKKRKGGGFQRLFRARDLPSERAIQPRAIPPRATSPRSPGNRVVPQASGMRTLCVRTCDGYYFPISHSATRKRFKVDEAVCKAMYGGAGAELFVHNNAAPAETAVSLKGTPLAREPYAFAYRQTFNEACHAELKDGLNRLGVAFLARAADQASPAPNDQSRAPPDPPARVALGIDPETAANRSGRLTTQPVPSKDTEIAAASKLRKLGSDYYYADPVEIVSLGDPMPRVPEFSLIGSAVAQSASTASSEP